MQANTELMNEMKLNYAGKKFPNLKKERATLRKEGLEPPSNQAGTRPREPDAPANTPRWGLIAVDTHILNEISMWNSCNTTLKI